MKKENLFVENYNNSNNINFKGNLNLYDECCFSYLDILKEKEVEVLSKTVKNCKCMESVNFNTYYSKCEKCEGKGKLIINGNEVICNHCHGEKKVVKNVCPLCNGEGKVIKSGKVKVKLDNSLNDGDTIVVKSKGKESNGITGDLYIKVKIHDKDCFKVDGNDVYDRRMIEFSKEDISKNVSKTIETIKGYANVKSNGVDSKEIIKIENEGIDNGSYYVCLKNELVAIRGEDVYKNVIVNKKMLGFYLNKEEFFDGKKCLNVYYFKKVEDKDFVYVELDNAYNFKIIKLKEKGLDGKYGGANGDLYLRVYFDDEFTVINDKLYSFPINLTRYEVNEGKKVLEFDKNKITLTFDKNIDKENLIEVKDYGFMTSKNEFDCVTFVVNPFKYNVYKVSVRVNKKDKIVYLKEYKKYFYEEVKQYNEGLKVTLSKKKEIVVNDDEGNKVIVRILK